MSEILYVQALSSRSAKSAEDMVDTIFDEGLNRMGPPSLIVLPEYFIGGAELFEGRKMTDPEVAALEKYSREVGSHIVSGMVEISEGGEKYITGLLFGPRKGLIGKRRKATPTPFEIEHGVGHSTEEVRTYELENGIGTLAIALGIESYEFDLELRTSPAEILVNPRGFDLDDDRFGLFSTDWLEHNQDLARMGKRIVAGTTGPIIGHGTLVEIIDHEGRIVDNTTQPDSVVEGYMHMDELRDYREGNITSRFVPAFTNGFLNPVSSVPRG